MSFFSSNFNAKNIYLFLSFSVCKLSTNGKDIIYRSDWFDRLSNNFYLYTSFFNEIKNPRYYVIIAEPLQGKEGLEETIKSCDQIAPCVVRSILWKMYSVLVVSSTVWIIERTTGSRVQINLGLVLISRRWQSHAQGSIWDNKRSYSLSSLFLPVASWVQIDTKWPIAERYLSA